ncbi:serine-threonine protein kinase, plant-type, putative [Ricinus communis]|uniref:Receptor-like serine/threonine-protein kinase n=1 Tax=Ricinus communis TaxID=3988 RepID=B9SIQ7_RICCO|nr:serine-threonine protein kinase, plant-type, putative [Ricinus communis]
MSNYWTRSILLYFLVFPRFICLLSVQSAGLFDFPTANLSTSWENIPSLRYSISFSDGSTIRPVLVRGFLGPRFGCGFYCNGNCESYLFAIFIIQSELGPLFISPDAPVDTVLDFGFPQVVWSANRNNPVRINATLQLTSDGDLVLKDADGTIAWSTDTGGQSVSGLNMTDMGNLVLFDDNNAIVWQSFDHPTDCLVPGQKLKEGQKLIPSVSATNWTELSLLSLTVSKTACVALIESSPPQAYYETYSSGTKTNEEPTYVVLENGSFTLFVDSNTRTYVTIPVALSAQYLRFGATGQLRLYEWNTQGAAWRIVTDVTSVTGGVCFYPTVCGNYGICSKGQCSCPASDSGRTTYFRHVNDREPNLGCSETTSLSCEVSEYHNFLELTDTTYFSFRTDLENVDSKRCKEACLQNCSCKAAIFRYGSDHANGSCHLPNQILSLINNEPEATDYNSTVFVKVQNNSIDKVENNSTTARRKAKNRVAVILGSSLGSFFGLLLLVGIFVLLVWKERNGEAEEDYLDQVPGMPTRFSFEDLKAITENFRKVLGEGGFGTAFEGTTADGTKIAVKRLNGLDQVKKSFLAEVESIGSLHHMNLVRLLGFCAEKSHRLLVYEFMSNGSLDKWIFHQSREFVLDWKQRKKIILDIAKGLTYLHEECSQKVIHLDIKPQNILLDNQFNAKICDFGLSKLIHRDQSKVVTTMRGTPGYLAPEWLSSVITEKVDIYSFGIVVLEMLCGRRNIDPSQPEELMHLLSIFEKKVEENRLVDLVDSCIEDIHREEVMNLMRLAAWCLQRDHTRRPSMSMVVKVLEGVAEVEDDLDYNLPNPASNRTFAEASPLNQVLTSVKKCFHISMLCLIMLETDFNCVSERDFTF